MDEIEWWEFGSADELAEQAAGDIGFVIERAIEAHGGARLALPGEGAPEPVLAALANHPGIDWTKVTLIPTDARLVPLDHEQSSSRRFDHWFGARGAEIVSLVDEAALDDYREAGRLADARLALLHWPLDLAWLGVGPGGATAAMLPGPDLDRAVAGPRERRAVGVRPADGSGDRITLTAATLSSARAVIILLHGSDSRRTLEQALKEGPLASAPIGRVAAEIDAPIDIYWSAEG
jgi:6-phosphogluconolactonase